MATESIHDGRVSRETVQGAVNALLKWKKSKSKGTQKSQLLTEEDDCIYLMLTLKKTPQQSRTTPHKIPLPHSLHQLRGDQSLFSEFCLIIDDRPKPKPNSKLTSEAAKKKIKSEDVPIAKVLKFSKLKSDYKSFEAKKKLCDSHSLFFADKRVVPLLPKLLGKQFFKKKRKIPVPVDLTHRNWKEQIETACSSALLCLSTGTCSVVRVGNVCMERRDIFENVLAAIDSIAEIVPKKWDGVRSFHLKFSDSLALPIYQAFPDMQLKIEGITEGGSEDSKKTKEKKKGDRKMGMIKGLRKGD